MHPSALELNDGLMSNVSQFVQHAYGQSRSKGKAKDETIREPCSEMSKSSEMLPSTSDNHIDSNIILNEVNPWTLIQTLKVVEAEELMEADMKKALDKQQRMCSNLNEQVRCKQLASNVEKLELIDLKSKQEQELKSWKQEQENVMRANKEKLCELRRVRQLQLEERNRSRRREIEAERIRSSLEINEIKASLQREEDDKRRKKDQESKRWKDIIEENEKVAAEKRRRSHEETQFEIRLMTEMKEKLDREQEARSDSTKNRFLRAEESAQRVSESVLRIKENEEKQRDREILRQVQEKERAQAEEEIRRKAVREQMQALVNNSNGMIIQEKKTRQLQLELQDELFAAQSRKENEKIMAEKSRTIQRENEVKRGFKEALDEQVKEKEKHQMDTQGMTNVERSINKKVMMNIMNKIQFLLLVR